MTSPETEPRVIVRVFPFVTRMVPRLMPRSQLILFTFPDPHDPPMAVAETVSTDLFHTEPDEAGLSTQVRVRTDAALSQVRSLTFLNELADQINDG